MPSLRNLSLLAGFCVGANAMFTNFTRYNNVYARSTYSLVDTYDSSNWYSMMDFYTGSDPTHGFVDYQSQSDAESSGIVNTANNQVYMGVDWTTSDTVNGRPSVRVTSANAYTHGLFIADIAHMPDSDCGVWPSWWMFGPDWPSNGEIDIIEGVNQNSVNTITLHTSSGCSADISGSQSTTSLLETDCNADNGNDGCGVSTTNTANYGTGFNAGGGGVYALQWESTGIYIWFFPRGSIPSDITDGTPLPSGWGTPVVAFNNGANCDIDEYFNSNSMVFDTTFCGDWAGSVWSSGTCSSLASTCDAYVQDNPSAFEYAYWLINSVQVYQLA